MSTVLTKPVLLDETGQAIVGKLQDIQQAIGGTGEFIPINIRVTTPPTKTSYLAGETLDLSGMVVTLVANNGGMYDVTGDCVFSPADGSVVTSSTTEVNISYTWYKDSTVFTAVQPISIKALTSIAVTTPPTVTEYAPGDTLDLTGIVVTATFDDSTTEIVTSQCVFSPADGDTLSMGDDTVSISYTLGTTTATTTQAISVSYPIYGVEWDGTATSALTRTDAAANFVDPVPSMSDGNGGFTAGSSPFDDIYPWSDIERTDEYNQAVGTLVKIPKFYYKWTRNGDAMKLQISRGEFEGSHVSPAHQKRPNGYNETDFVYVGAYHSIDSNCKSLAAGSPIVNLMFGYSMSNTAQTKAHALGSDVWMCDFTMYWTIAMLYLVEFADWNCRTKIGKGTISKSIQNTLAGMTYHTGTSATTRSATSHTRYRWIEDLWGNVADWVNGVGIFADSQTIDGVLHYAVKASNLPAVHDLKTVGWVPDQSNQNVWSSITNWTTPEEEGYEYALFPLLPAYLGSSAAVTDYDTYCCASADTKIGTSQGMYITVGGDGAGSSLLSFWNYRTSSGQSNIGMRVMKLPNTP